MSAAQKILVADDSLTIRKLVENVLVQEGYEIIAVANGADCLAQAAEQKPSLILLDYILPDMQGTEICRNLINSPGTWEIPVLMMSSNGNAIRQLYQDLNNVADYLTKPFAPNVLKAVVGHLLNKQKPAAEGETSSTVTAEGTAPAEPAVPQEFMDKVNRLLHLMENGAPASAPAAVSRPEVDAAAAAPVVTEAPKKKRRARKPVASAPAPESVLRKFRLALRKHLRARARQIPDWELSRGTEDAAEFHLARLLNKEALWDLSAELLRATGAPAESTGALRSPSSLVPLDAVLRHLHTSRATGELRIETGEETVLACIENGQVVLLTTNNPHHYCAGAACDFQAVMHTTIGEAVRAQEEQSLPFFITLHQEGFLPAGPALNELLRVQGERCLARVFKTDSVITFHPLLRLPAMVRAHRQHFPLNQLLLVCHRTVEDWFTLGNTFTDMDVLLVPSADFLAQLDELHLDAEEKRVVQAVRVNRTISELASATQLKPFEACRILYRFVTLGLIRQESNAQPDSRTDGEMIVIAAPEAEREEEVVVPMVAEEILPTASDLDRSEEASSEMAPEEEAAGPVASVAQITLTGAGGTCSSTQAPALQGEVPVI